MTNILEPVVSAALPREAEERQVYVPERPMTFAEYLATFGPKDSIELVKGVPQERMAAQLDHERLISFLISALRQHAEDFGLGEVLGSRTAVQIGVNGARLPDILFVRAENVPDLEPRGIRFAPDLVIEIISPGDRPSEQISLEADYRSIGIPEVAFVDRRRGRVRVVRRQAGAALDASNAYAEETLTRPEATLRLDTLGGITLPISWLLTNARPPVRDVLARWSAEAPLAPGR